MMSLRIASTPPGRSSASGASGSVSGASRGSTNSPGAAGRPGFPPSVRVAVTALACELPGRWGVPLAQWSRTELPRAVLAQGLVAEISGTTIWRWLAADAIQPWRVRSWLFPRDPAFAAKAGRVLDLYERRWDGRPLGPTEYVLSADEKTSIQARDRCHPTLPPGPGAPMRVEHESVRGAPGPTTRPGMSTGPRCSADARPPPAWPRLIAWWPK